MNFDENNLSLLYPITSDNELKFKSNKTGETYNAKPEDTLLMGEEIGTGYSMTKYKAAITSIAHDPTNSRIEKECPKCKNAVLSFALFGDEKKTIYACLCGYNSIY